MKEKYDELLSCFAFNIKLRRYGEVPRPQLFTEPALPAGLSVIVVGAGVSVGRCRLNLFLIKAKEICRIPD